MPKLGQSAAAPRATPRPMPAATGATATSIMPGPRPQNTAQQPRQTLGSRIGSFFPEKGSQEQYDLVMQLVQAGMANAQASGSPIANLLAPLAGAIISGRATRNRQDAAAGRSGQMANAVLGKASSDPKVQGYLSVLNDPNAPDYLKQMAKAKLDAATKPGLPPRTARTSPKRSSGTTPSKASKTRLYGEYDIGGILHGRDPYGNMVPYVSPSGEPVPFPGSKNKPAVTPAVTPLPSVQPTPVLPTAPVLPVLPAGAEEIDPLGILSIPPA